VALSDALLMETAKRKGPRCTMCVLVESLDKEDAAVLAEYLANPNVPSTAIGRALAREGHNISGETVRRHRDRRCGGATA